MSPRNSDESEWHLDKRVPIAIMVLAFIGQTVTLVYVGTDWKSDIDHRVISLERTDEMRRPQESRILIVEQQLKFIIDTVSRIESKIDRRDDSHP